VTRLSGPVPVGDLQRIIGLLWVAPDVRERRAHATATARTKDARSAWEIAGRIAEEIDTLAKRFYDEAYKKAMQAQEFAQERALYITTDIYEGVRLMRRQKKTIARRRLQRLYKAAQEIERILAAIDARGAEVAHLRGRKTYDVDGVGEMYLPDQDWSYGDELKRASAFAARTQRALQSFSWGKRNIGELIRALAEVWFMQHHERPRPASTQFLELVSVALGLRDPGKEVRQALK
jgi:hypothetical protein